MIKTLMKVIGGLVAILLVAAAGLAYVGSKKLTSPRALPVRPITVVRDSQTIARGQHLATAIMKCVDCHGTDLGGTTPLAEMGPMGTVHSANLTSGVGGRMGAYGDDATLAAVIRHGITKDGIPIPIMPAAAYYRASDADMSALIAYLRSLPKVDRVIPPSNVGALGRILYAAGQFSVIEADFVDHSSAPFPDQTPSPTVEYGRYLTEIGGCTSCHGAALSGGPIPGGDPSWRPATNITPEGLKGWTEQDFITAMKTGVRPNGVPIDTLMPWRQAALMDSVEFAATWKFLQSMPAKAYREK